MNSQGIERERRYGEVAAFACLRKDDPCRDVAVVQQNNVMSFANSGCNARKHVFDKRWTIEAGMPKNVIGKALKDYRERAKLTLSEMAAMVKVSAATVVNYETGRRFPDVDFLVDFAEASGEDLLYWLSLRVAGSRSAGASSARALLDRVNLTRGSLADRTIRPLVSLPVHDIKDAANAASATGAGRAADEVMQFSTNWIKHELNASPQDLYLIHVDDESMEPTLRPRDTILLDRRVTKPDREGVYILNVEGVPLVKRLQILPGGVVRVVSDNPAYETFTIRLSDINCRDFAILGRVVWVVWAGRRI